MSAAQRRLPTLLLAAFAGWSALVFVAVQTGLGARYSLHPDDASRVPELPRLDLSRAQTPLGPLTEYAQVGERPLFNPDRRPIPPPAAAPAEGGQPPPVALDVVLTSVILSGDTRIAIVLDKKTNKSQSVKLGDALAGDQSAWKLVELAPRKAVFEGPTGRNEAELRVFDGSGGEAPTPVASSAVEGTPAATPAAGVTPEAAAAANPAQPQTPEARAELIRRRIEERRRQMREEAERANKQNGGQ